MVNLNNKYKAFSNLTRYFLITGGRASGKSFAVSVLVLLLSFEKGHKILFTRYTMTSARLSIIPEFIDKIKTLGLLESFKITNEGIVNIATGSEIIFKGIKTSSGDQTANLKSLQGITTWILDEAEELKKEEIFDTIDLSIREQNAQNRVVLIMNPSTKAHWIYKRFLEGKGVKPSTNVVKDDTTYIHTTYLDNKQYLSESFIERIEQMKEDRPDKYQHQILGGWRKVQEGVIFDNWEVGTFPNVDAIYGMDFGFSIDPSTLVATHIDKDRKLIYLKEIFYKPKLTTSEIYTLSSKSSGLIIADSAEPRMIAELKARGLNITKALKPQGSIKDGIAMMQDYRMIIDPISVNLIEELNNYAWLDNKETPIDSYNHSIDAARYAIYYQLEKPNKGVYHVL